MGGQVKLLINGRNAQLLGILRPFDVNKLTLPKDLPLVSGIGPGQNFDQRRLAGPILSLQGENLAFLDGQGYPVQGLDAGK